MITVTPQSDDILRTRLDGLSTLDVDFWSFKGNARREHVHGFSQYPAMMVPQMVEAILNEICAVHPEIQWVTDPYAGSGTILTEAMVRGLSFAGSDINPLAILLCRAKGGPFFTEALRRSSDTLLNHIKADQKRDVEISFSGIDKWFTEDVQIDLSRIRRCIQHERSRFTRRFLWVALGETVRLTSNSRTSTFKLHIRPAADLKSRQTDATKVFERILMRNVSYMNDFVKLLRAKQLTKRGRYTGEVVISLGDSRTSSPLGNGGCDLLISSPPYGDNATTVPYGQFSFLPLQWIDLDDIDSHAKADYLRTTHEIDFRSLGGSRRIKSNARQSIVARSPTLGRLLDHLDGESEDHPRRVTAFFRDLDKGLSQNLLALRPGSLMVWVLGNRRVADMQVPLDCILRELLEKHGAKLVVKLARRIPSKRMAIKNNIAKTMSAESILVMRKAI